MTENIVLSKLRPADPRGTIYKEIEDFGFDDDNSPSNIRSKHQVTKKIKKFGFRKKKYKSITDEMREELINAIQNEGLKIKHAAQKLRMNYSSAKSIFKIYKREGRLNKKIFKRRAEDLEEGGLEGTPMSDDLESSDNCHESESPVVPKEEFSTSEGFHDQASLKILIQAQENQENSKETPEKVESSPLLKQEEVELSSASSIKESRENLKWKVKVQENAVQPHQNHINFSSMEDLVKQRPILFGANPAAIPSNFKVMPQQPMFPPKLPTNFSPTGFIPNMESFQILGQNVPGAIHFIPQHNMNYVMGNKMNPYFPHPYIQNINGLEPFINYSLYNNLNNNYPLRMSSSTNTSNHHN